MEAGISVGNFSPLIQHKVRWWIGHDDNSKSSGNGQILDIFEGKPTEYVDGLDMCFIRKKKTMNYITVYSRSN